RPHAPGGRRFAARRRFGATLASASRHTTQDTAMIALQGGQTRKGGLHAHQFWIAGVNAGHERIGQRLGHLRTDAPADEGVDGLVTIAPSPWTKTLGQQKETCAPAERIGRKQGEQTVRQQTQPAIEEQITIAPRGIAGDEKMIAQPQFAAQGEGKRLVIEETVGADFNLEALVALGADAAAQTRTLLHNDHVRVRHPLFEPIGEGQPRDSTADDDNSWHDYITSPQRRQRTPLLAPQAGPSLFIDRVRDNLPDRGPLPVARDPPLAYRRSVPERCRAVYGPAAPPACTRPRPSGRRRRRHRGGQ